jgi:hypothetical protein
VTLCLRAFRPTFTQKGAFFNKNTLFFAYILAPHDYSAIFVLNINYKTNN